MNRKETIMKNHIIFYFSGTGNSLALSKEISKRLENVHLVSMGNEASYTLNEPYDTIGFIYPTYFGGAPAKVIDFVSKLKIRPNQDTYCYAVTTCGGLAANALPHVNEALKTSTNKTLNYGAVLKMFSNYVVLYDMKPNVKEITEKSYREMGSIIEAIVTKAEKKTKSVNPLAHFYYKAQMKITPKRDHHFTVSEACTACGLCSQVCPVQNVEIIEGKPAFHHHCEQCVACIQYCPTKAINYKNKTQNRRRYTHPDISIEEMTR